MSQNQKTYSVEQRDRVRIVNIILVLMTGIALLLAAVLGFGRLGSSPDLAKELGLVLMLSLVGVCLVLRLINNPERVRAIGTALSLTIIAVQLLISHTDGGYNGGSKDSVLFVLVLIAVLADRRDFLWLAGLYLAGYIGLIVIEESIPAMRVTEPAIFDGIFISVEIVGGAALLYWVIGRLNASRLAFAQQAEELALANRQLTDQQRVQAQTLQRLEQAVAQMGQISSQQTSNAEAQAASFSQVSAGAQELERTAHAVAHNAAEVSQLAADCKHEAQAALAELERSQQGTTAVRLRMNDLADLTRSLAVQAEQIGAINQLLESISDETRVLSLNASIEAAGAADEQLGRRFSVIAREVQDLAARATTSTAEVRSLIAEVQGAMGGMVAATEQGVSESSSNVAALSRVVAAMDRLNNLVERTDAAAHTILQAAAQQEAGSQQIAGAMREVSSLSSDRSHVTHELRRTMETLARLSERPTASV